ncbi:MAG: FkbM family methyltransferase [Candidatus Pacebacteria bacterium]|nr:FkbM family methyltransferase [Candidatus Paceibacterota bacterium]
MRDLNIRTVIDIGASKGGFSAELHGVLPEAQIYAFEPLSDCFAQIQERMKGVSKFRAFNLALGDTPGKVVMHRSSYSGCSSLREMASLHKDTFPVTAGQETISVAVSTLDEALSDYSLEENIMVKIDVQGFEDKVIAGGLEMLKRSRVILIETSFKELYVGQPLFDGVYHLLRSLGFQYRGAWAPELKSPLDGSPLQQDSIFIREG